MKSFDDGVDRTGNKNFRTLILISMLGTALGIFREVFLIIILGVSRSNDNLQIYLSIIYNVSLLGEVARLSVLNLLEKHHFYHFFGYGIFFYTTLAIAIGSIHFLLSDNLDIIKLILVISIGALNVIVVMISVYIQTQGREVVAQKIGLLPNFILLPALLIVYTLFGDQFILATLIAYIFVPLAQIFFLKRHIPAKYEGGGESDIKHIFAAFILHSPLVFGTILAQIAVRNSLFILGVGYLTIYNFLQKILDSIRVIFVETYIASKLKIWQQKEKKFLEKRTITYIILFIFGVSLFSLANFVLFAVEIRILLIIVIGFSLQMFNRIAYIQMNVEKTKKKFSIWFYIFLEFVFALIIYLTSHSTAIVIYGYFMYFIIKNMIQMFLITLSGEGKVSNEFNQSA